MPGPGGARYTHGHHESVLRSHRWRTAENAAAYLLAHLRSGQRLLDVGCGPGSITVEERAWWGGTWAERVTRSAFADSAVDQGLAARAELDDLAAGWRSWAEAENAWFAVLHGEVLCQP